MNMNDCGMGLMAEEGGEFLVGPPAIQREIQ